MNLIDLTTDTQFHHSTWIGTGKKFSNSLPQEVYDKKREILEVPDSILTQLPTSVTLVSDFVNYPLPLQTCSFDFHQTGEWFSTDMALTFPEVLLARPIPSEKVLKTLDAAIGQMWFDGARSIVDPRFNNGTERFPLWVLSLWNKIQKMIGHQKQWRSSIQWLELITHPEDIVVQAKRLIEKLPWNGPLCFGGASTIEYAGFIGASWLTDTQIDMMVNVLRGRMAAEGHTKWALVEPITLAWELVIIGNEQRDALVSPYLSRLADQIQAGIAEIWFPINMNQNHWIAGRVDFENCTFAFGKPQAVCDRDWKD